MEYSQYNQYGYGYFKYVPVAERKDRNTVMAEKLSKTYGRPLCPIDLQGRRNIAQTFWGNAWIDHIESLGDYANRLPRGRDYLRQGAVLDVQIQTGRITAMVNGSRLYKVSIDIDPLPKLRWEALKRVCMGKITSLISLVQGKLSDEIIRMFCSPETGLFPMENEIHITCSCPDWAYVCKHVAAVLYAIGVKFDQEPKLLFVLRDIDENELISAEVVEDMVDSLETDLKPDFRFDELSAIFGIELDSLDDLPTDSPDPPLPKARKKRTAPKSRCKKAKAETETDTEAITGTGGEAEK